jgi:cyclopropane fatty-acyl-phospholipid synthase-like methyltransferase
MTVADMIAALLSAVPFAGDDELRIVDVGSGDGALAEALLARFARATLVTLAGSESSRAVTAERIARFGGRAKVRPLEIAALDWWDLMFGADLIVALQSIHHLNDAKKQYLYKAAAERLSPRGALLIADRVQSQRPDATPPEPGTHTSALFHQLVWLRHAGFVAVDCFWLLNGAAVFGGFKQAEASAPRPPADS